MNRREFLKNSSLLAGAVVAERLAGLENFAFAAAATGSDGMPLRSLGSTGEQISCVGLGGSHIGRQFLESESVRIVRGALDNGITFLDNAWDYNGGASEERMGKALRDGYRAKAFLMTKFDGRTRVAAAKLIDESLRRLKTDRIDLLMCHEVIRRNDAERFFDKGGGVEAALAARNAGKARYLGFTGHKDPSIHLHMLDLAREHGFRFDAVLMPINVMDAHYRSFQEQVLPRLVAERIGVLSMKPLGGGVILKSKAATPQECLRYALTVNPGTVITGIDSMEILQQTLQVVRNFKPMSRQAMAELLGRTAKYAADGKYEVFKTTDHFDSTVKHPEWLG